LPARSACFPAQKNKKSQWRNQTASKSKRAEFSLFIKERDQESFLKRLKNSASFLTDKAPEGAFCQKQGERRGLNQDASYKKLLWNGVGTEGNIFDALPPRRC